MKNFKYPLAIEGTKEQLEALVSKLELLGYTKPNNFNCYDTFHHFLMTNFWGNSNEIQFLEESRSDQFDRTKVSASNPDLVLALAAMVDDNKPHIGEYYFTNWNPKIRDIDDGRLIRVDSISSIGDIITNSDPGNRYFDTSNRKATKEEIISHFSLKTFNGVEPKTMEKKIIGYKLKDDCKQYVEALDAISCCFSSGAKDRVLSITSAFVNDYRDAGVLDLWFEPVYEEKFKVGDYLYCLHDGAFNCKSNGKAGDVLKILSFENEMSYTQKVMFEDGKCAASNGDLYTKYFRLATPEEIAATQTKVITLRCEGGTFEIEVSKDRIWYAPEDASLNVGTLREIVRSRVIGKNYSFTPSHIDSGCKKQVPIEDWKKVLEAYDSLNK